MALVPETLVPDVGNGCPSGETDPGYESADSAAVGAVGVAVAVAEVGLFDDTHLQFYRGEQQREADKREWVRCKKHDAGAEDEHGGEDGIADETEDPGVDEIGCLGGIDADAPGFTHLVLCVERADESGQREHDPHRLDSRSGEYADRVQYCG